MRQKNTRSDMTQADVWKVFDLQRPAVPGHRVLTPTNLAVLSSTAIGLGGGKAGGPAAPQPNFCVKIWAI